MIPICSARFCTFKNVPVGVSIQCKMKNTPVQPWFACFNVQLILWAAFFDRHKKVVYWRLSVKVAIKMFNKNYPREPWEFDQLGFFSIKKENLWKFQIFFTQEKFECQGTSREPERESKNWKFQFKFTNHGQTELKQIQANYIDILFIDRVQ